MAYKNIFYFDNINSIGGCETFFYYLSKQYQDKDITIVYTTGDLNQIKRLKKYARVIRHIGQKIECKKAFFNYSTAIIDDVIADEYIQIIHCDYLIEDRNPVLNPKITRYIGVSKQVCKSFTKVTGKKCELCYNPVTIDEPQKFFTFISATRLTWQKRKRTYAKVR